MLSSVTLDYQATMIFIWQSKPTPSDVHIFLETFETSWIWPLLKIFFFCSFCCSHYAPLGYKKMETDRVCFACFEKLKTSEKVLVFLFNYFDNRHGIFRLYIINSRVWKPDWCSEAVQELFQMQRIFRKIKQKTRKPSKHWWESQNKHILL